MSIRLSLQAVLESLLNCTVYFDPPESIKLSYPCVVYSLAKKDILRADNKVYQMRNMYTVKCLSKDPDNNMADILLNALPYSSFENRYTHDHIHHDVLNIYYWKDPDMFGKILAEDYSALLDEEQSTLKQD